MSIRARASNTNGRADGCLRCDRKSKRTVASRLSPLSERGLPRDSRDPDSVGGGELAGLRHRAHATRARIRRALSVHPDDGLHDSRRPSGGPRRSQADTGGQLFVVGDCGGRLSDAGVDADCGHLAVLRGADAVRRGARICGTGVAIICAAAGAAGAISTGRRVELLDVAGCGDCGAGAWRCDLHSGAGGGLRRVPGAVRDDRDS